MKFVNLKVHINRASSSPSAQIELSVDVEHRVSFSDLSTSSQKEPLRHIQIAPNRELMTSYMNVLII